MYFFFSFFKSLYTFYSFKYYDLDYLIGLKKYFWTLNYSSWSQNRGPHGPHHHAYHKCRRSYIYTFNIFYNFFPYFFWWRSWFFLFGNSSHPSFESFQCFFLFLFVTCVYNKILNLLEYNSHCLVLKWRKKENDSCFF
jgi:hypothetical protein